MSNTLPDASLIIDEEPYELLEVSPGRRMWQVDQVPTQPGDGSRALPFPIEFHGGFGATVRHTDARGRQSDPTHHDRAQNFNALHKGILANWARITFVDMTTSIGAVTGLQLGGNANARLGGGIGGMGGGTFTEQPQAIEEFGKFLYVGAGPHTFIVDPAATTPSVVEVKTHGAAARAKSMDVWDNKLIVALGAGQDMDIALEPRGGSGASTQWDVATGVRRDAVRTGKGGRLFTSLANRVFNVLSGQDPLDSNKHLPPAGEVITDETDPVRSLEEFARGLVAGTARTVRAFDPDAGFIGRSLLRESRLSASEFDGRSLITLGPRMLFATARAVWLFVLGQFPVNVGPELLVNNNSPYIGGEPGIPDSLGDWIAWPFFFPTTGDSVIFFVRFRQEGEEGTGPLMWGDPIYLSGRICRIVKFWGGDGTVKPRLFFGAGTTAKPAQFGWNDLGRGGGPDIFDTDAQPALSGTIFGTQDDLGKPGVIREVERFEVPDVRNADADNHAVVSVTDDGGTNYKDLVKTQEGNTEDTQINATGFATVYAQTSDVPAGRTLGVKLIFTQATAATTFLHFLGVPTMYVSERPVTTRQFTTALDIKGIRNIETAEDEAARIEDLVGGAKVKVAGGPDDLDIHARFVSVRAQEIEMFDKDGHTAGHRLGIAITFREVATSQS